MLRVEEHGGAAAGDHDQREVLVDVGGGDGGLDGLGEVRQRIHQGGAGAAPVQVLSGVQLHLAGGSPEAGLAVSPQGAGLVAVVGDPGHLGLHFLGLALGVGPLPAALGLQALVGLAGGLQAPVHIVLEAVGEALGEVGVEAGGHLAGDVPVVLTLAHLDGRLNDLDGLEPAAEAGALGEGGGGQDDVGHRHGGGVVEQVHHHVEVHGHHGLIVELHVGAPGHGVGGLGPGGLDGIGLLSQHLVDGQVGLDVAAPLTQPAVLVGADALLDHVLHELLAEHIGQLIVVEGIGGHVIAVAGDDLAAGDVQVAGDGPQVVDGLGGVDAVGDLVQGQAPLDGGAGGVLGVHLGGLVDGLLGHPGQGGDLLQGVLLGALLQLLEAGAPLLHELVVVPVVLDDHVDHGHGDGGVGAGTQLQVVLGTGGQPVLAGIHHDQLGAALHAVHDPVAVEAVLAAPGGILGPDDDDLGGLPAGIVIALLQELGAVADGVVALHGGHGAQTGAVAGLTGQAQLRPVGAAVVVGHDGHGAADVAAGALDEDDGVGAVLFLDLVELLLNDVIGLIPGDALEAAVAPGTDALQGIEDALGMVHELGHGQQAGTSAPVVIGVISVALDLDHLVALDIDLDAAAAVAAGAGGSGGGSYDAIILDAHGNSSFFSSYTVLSPAAHTGKGQHDRNGSLRCQMQSTTGGGEKETSNQDD